MLGAEFYDDYIKQSQGGLQQYRLRKAFSLIDPEAKDLLDIGCGRGELLALLRERFPNARLVGIDIASSTPRDLAARGLEGHTVDAGAELPFESGSFDVIFCGEIIEHVVNVDLLVSEAFRVLKKGGSFILTTPNLAYAVNRVLLALGIQPLFTETSVYKNLGRHFRFLGQHGNVQGHLKVFTLSALRELLVGAGFSNLRAFGYPFINSGPLAIVDRVLCVRPSLAAGFVVEARKPRDA